VAQLYGNKVIRDYVGGLIRNAPRGTQAKLARELGAPVQTVNKWALGMTCPSPRSWSVIEQFFELEEGTLSGLGGLTDQKLTDAETALLSAEELTDDDRETVLRVYRSLRTGGGRRAPRSPRVSPSASG
jgi:hypothetical protein